MFKKLDFFSLGEVNGSIWMGLGGGLFQFKTFGNMTHPNVLRKIDFYHCIDLNIPKKLMQTNNAFF